LGGRREGSYKQLANPLPFSLPNPPSSHPPLTCPALPDLWETNEPHANKRPVEKLTLYPQRAGQGSFRFLNYGISITFRVKVKENTPIYIDEKEEGGKKRSKRLYSKMRSIWDIGNFFLRNRKSFSYILNLTFPKIWIYYFLCPQG